MSVGIVGVVLFVFGLVVVAAFVFWVWAIVDIVRTPDPVFASAGHNKIVWAIVVVFLHWIGALIWVIAGRPQLRRTYRPF